MCKGITPWRRIDGDGIKPHVFLTSKLREGDDDHVNGYVYVSELRPLTDLFFKPQVIHAHGET
jgi:hypothetical protein